MVELVATVIITASSVVLFAYWFRYTCLLILSAKTARDYAATVVHANKLGFLEVQAQLQQSSIPDMDRLRAALDQDYRVVQNLLKHMPQSSEGQSLETRMLAVNYKLMRTWYNISRKFSTSTAARALGEMSMVVSHFANVMGEQTASATA
jgi:hypothetical protein